MATKKQLESDKNLLFSKLLPAINDNPFSNLRDDSPENALPQYHIDKEPQQPMEDGDNSLSALYSRLFARNRNQDIHVYATINIMECLVLRYIDQVIQRFNACGCDRCKCDVAAFALNNLPTKYIVASPQRAKQIEDEVPQKMVMDALVNAIIHVRAKPRH